MELNNHQFLKPLVLLAALKQFEYQATNRLLLVASEECGDFSFKIKTFKNTPYFLSLKSLMSLPMNIIRNYSKLYTSILHT